MEGKVTTAEIVWCIFNSLRVVVRVARCYTPESRPVALTLLPSGEGGSVGAPPPLFTFRPVAVIYV